MHSVSEPSPGKNNYLTKCVMHSWLTLVLCGRSIWPILIFELSEILVCFFLTFCDFFFFRVRNMHTKFEYTVICFDMYTHHFTWCLWVILTCLNVLMQLAQTQNNKVSWLYFVILVFFYNLMKPKRSFSPHI